MYKTIIQESKIKLWIIGTAIIIPIILINYGIIFEKKNIVYSLFFLQVFIILLLVFRRYPIEILVTSILFSKILYWPLRIYPVLLISLLLVFYFLTYYYLNDFNKLKLPFSVKTNLLFLILSVMASSFLTPYFSFYTVYYGVIYFLLAITFFVIFRKIFNTDKIIKLLNLFVLFVFISGLTKIYYVIISGLPRALGIAEFFYMEFAPIALLVVFFLYFIWDIFKSKTIFFTLIIFITVIADQSRFAWLGLTISFIYGLIISLKFSPEVKINLRKRIPVIIVIMIFIFGLVFVFGLHNIISSRVSEIHLNFFQETDKIQEGQYVSNSLETRILIWMTAYNTFINNPLFGVGYSMFIEVSENYNIFPQVIYDMYVANCDAHTTYFNYLVDTGIVGFLAFLSFTINIFIFSFKAIIYSDKKEKSLSIVLNVIMFHMMVNSIYAGSYNLIPSSVFYFFISASIIANYLLIKKENKK